VGSITGDNALDRSVANSLIQLVVVAISAIAPALLSAQQDSTRRVPPRPAADTGAQPLGPVQVTVTRDAARSTLELPFAISRLTPDATRPGLRRASVAELLLGVPGVMVQERANPAQDPRIAVRGFGARSAFGVRGVRVMRDGIPLTLPDGQTPIDWLDLESIGQIDVIRGTAAALYGNAAGGVLDFRSRAPQAQPFALDARLWDGGGMRRSSVQASGTLGDSVGVLRAPAWSGAFTRSVGDGPRAWSRLEATSGVARVLATVAGTRLEVQGTMYDTPRAENTGALTAEELARDPRLPDSLNVRRRSRKAVSHAQLALLASRGSGANVLDASLFTSTRSLDNPLAFAIVGVERRVLGGSLRGAWRTERPPFPLRLSAGVDGQHQVDDRANFENCAEVAPTAPVSVRCPASGQERGAFRLDQQERVTGVGAFVRTEAELPKQIYASAALRYDRVGFRVRDRFIAGTNRDDSGMRTLDAISPMVGLAWRMAPLWSAYVNVSSAFETPTITELTNQDNGAVGLNAVLDPQRTRTAELGLQGVIASRIKLEAALFDASVQDELVPFDVPNQPGRRAFRNAGKTSRRGVESNVTLLLPLVDVGVAYTASRFRFDRYVVGTVDFAGNAIPGVPSQMLQTYVTARRSGWFATIDGVAASRVTANDAATVFAAGYAAWNARAGYEGPAFRGVRIEPVLGVENLFDRRYAGSVVVNATRGRFYEPGLPRRVTFSVRVR